ncbi:MAG TPA: saccharopine dehydrogenase NADP-binding domain-containing protein [Thermoanaerobaculia bacterium]
MGGEGDRLVIYGATGYTGKLVSRAAAERGLEPLLAGRSEARLRAVAEPLGLPYRAAPVDDAAALDALLAEARVVLHLAGPFSATSRPMADACLRTGTHYLDVTGEIDVFEALAGRDAEARDRGIMLMPGVGFDVVPTDCLAAHLAACLPAATELRLYVSGLGAASRGTAKTGVESLGAGTRERRGGRIGRLRWGDRARVDFGDGDRECVAIGWGDVATAYHTTGIPDVRVYFEATAQLRTLDVLSRHFRWLMGSSPVKAVLKAAVERQPEGPSERHRARGRCVILGEARDAGGRRVRARLATPESYTLTVHTALAVAERVLAGAASPGFQTPGGLFGPDFILEFEGCERRDLDEDDVPS